MENLEIKMLLDKIEKRHNRISDRERFYLEKNIEIGLKYFNNLKKKNPDYTYKEMRQKFEDEQYKLLVDFSKESHIRGKYFQYMATRDLTKDKNKIAKIYQELRQDENINLDDIYYNVDMENNYQSVVKSILSLVEKRKQDIKARMMVNQYIHAGKQGLANIENDINQLENINLNKTDDSNKVLEYIEQTISRILPILESQLKDQLMNSMEVMGSFFEKFNLMQIYNALNISMLKSKGLSKLNQPLYKDKAGKKEVDLDQLFKKDYLQNLTIDDLLILNTFWQNRFAKESERIDDAVFAISKLNLLEGDNKKEITQDDMNYIALKIKIISGIEEILTKKISQELVGEIGEEGFKSIDASNMEREVLKAFQERYDEIIYKKTGRKDNDIITDYLDYSLLYNQIQNAYLCKSESIINLISMLENKKTYTNWGCVLDEVRNGKRINSAEDASKYILICMDYEGMNMPLRVHIDRFFINTFLRNAGKNMILPVYEGNEDFIDNNTVMSTNILMPVSNKYKKAINEYLKEENLPVNTRNLLEHLKYIKNNDKFPKHLQHRMGNKNRRMINIETGEEVNYERKNSDGR